MTELIRGANTGLAGGPLELSVSGARQGSVDLMVFQLNADRKVRSDADFVFFNQPASAEGAVRLIGADRITLQLAAVPAAVETLAVAVSMDDAAPGSLAGIPALGVTVRSGADEHQALASGLTTERSAVLVEVYRRAGAWKVRNVSAGWTAGLTALVREHGVTVDEAVALVPSPLAAGSPPSGSAPAPSAGTGRQTSPPTPDYLPPAVIPGPVPAPPSGDPGRAAEHPAAARGNLSSYPTPGGWIPPGGSLPPPVGQAVPTSPGGWPPPGGDLRPVDPPPPGGPLR